MISASGKSSVIGAELNSDSKGLVFGIIDIHNDNRQND